MTWAYWLAVPVGATTLASIGSWLRGWQLRRAARPLSTEDAVRVHADYLDALVIRARSAERVPHVDVS
jgi:hypothetical protein